jgi:hypothetical protein
MAKAGYSCAGVSIKGGQVRLTNTAARASRFATIAEMGMPFETAEHLAR